MTMLNSETLTAAADRFAPTVIRPRFDRAEVSVGIVHFGVGGFHRAHQAMYLDDLMNQGRALDWGICDAGVPAGAAPCWLSERT